MITMVMALVVLPPPLRLESHEMRAMTRACNVSRATLFSAPDGTTRVRADLPPPAMKCLLSELKRQAEKKSRSGKISD